MAGYKRADLYGGFFQTTRGESVPEAAEQMALATDTAAAVPPQKKANMIMGIAAMLVILIVLGAF
jgi:hypothetical protein